jgi:hypothetical protein
MPSLERNEVRILSWLHRLIVVLKFAKLEGGIELSYMRTSASKLAPFFTKEGDLSGKLQFIQWTA